MGSVIIGVSGGSGSGKTTFARRLAESLGPEVCQILYQDSYYRDYSEQFDCDGGVINFDHPESLDFDLLSRHLTDLRSGKRVEVPNYDFASHSRIEKITQFEPTPVILLDGILILTQPQICDLLDHSVFIECPEEVRFERRLKRDVAERGRTPEGVRAQFFGQVAPMHEKFVSPSRHQAARVFTEKTFEDNFLDVLKWIDSQLEPQRSSLGPSNAPNL